MKYTKDLLLKKEEFASKFAEIMELTLPRWKIIQSEYRKSIYSVKNLLYYFIFIFICFIPLEHGDYNLYIHFVFLLFVFPLVFLTDIYKKNKNYQAQIKKTFFPKILKIFGTYIHYAIVEYDEYLGNFSENSIPSSDLDRADFYKKEICEIKYDDTFSGVYKDIDFKINEVELYWAERHIGSNCATPHLLSRGVALQFRLNKHIENRLLIVSKRAFYRPPKDYQKVEVEYNKFAKKYNVYVRLGYSDPTSSQIEARYFLNVAFMDRFMQIQTSFKVSKVQCSIYEDEMIMFLDTGMIQDLFEMNHLFGKIDDIKQYEHLFDQFASIFSFIDVLNLSSKTKL